MRLYTDYRFNDPAVTAAFVNLALAQNLFQHAQTPDIIDAAIFDLTAAEFQLRAALKRARNKEQFIPPVPSADTARRFSGDKPALPPKPPLSRTHL